MSDNLPNCIDAEKSFLGALMLEEEKDLSFIDTVQEHEFYFREHRLIFKAIFDMRRRCQRITLSSVKQWLSDKFILDDIGGVAFLEECAKQVCSPVNLSEYAMQIRKTYLRRELIEAGRKLTRFASGNMVDPYTIMSAATIDMENLGLLPSFEMATNKHSFTALQLSQMEFPDHHYVIADLIPPGLGILAGRPKIGKSFVALDFAVSQSSGTLALGAKQTMKGRALYLALEDTPRRLKTRLKHFYETGRVTEDCLIYTEWPRMDEGGIRQLRMMLDRHSDLKLILIDTLARIRPITSTKNNIGVYLEDYEIMTRLKSLADHYNVAIVVVHHLRKEFAEDPLDKISGSTGITGASDTVILLDRTRGNADAELKVIGRDIEDSELALSFDNVRLTWSVLGNAQDYRLTQDKRKVLDALRAFNDPLTPSEIADIIDIELNKVKKILPKLIESNDILKSSHGHYKALNR